MSHITHFHTRTITMFSCYHSLYIELCYIFVLHLFFHRTSLKTESNSPEAQCNCINSAWSYANSHFLLKEIGRGWNLNVTHWWEEERCWMLIRNTTLTSFYSKETLGQRFKYNVEDIAEKFQRRKSKRHSCKRDTKKN